MCKVEAVNVTFLVDTGSNITILNPTVVEKISAQRRPTLEKVVNRMILADGSSKPFHGKGTFHLEVEGKQVQQEAWIADIELEGILGMDFVRQYGCQIISAPGGELRFQIPDLKSVPTAETVVATGLNNYQCLRVALGETLVIPANSEMVAAAKVLGKSEEGGLPVLEPTMEFVQRSKLLVGRSLINVDGPVAIRLLNPTPYPRRVYKDTLAALCELVEDVKEIPEAVETEVRLTRECYLPQFK